MTSSPNLDQMTPDQLRAFAAQLLSQVDFLKARAHREHYLARMAEMESREA